jgi:cell wall-associated NlpC family hydrolase
MIRDLIGCKFKAHGRSKEEGFDCYGLVIEVLQRDGISFPDMFYDNIEKETKIMIKNEMISSISHTKIDKPEKNCIVEISVGGNPSHIGVYIGRGEFIHCLTDYGVIIDKLHRYQERILGYYRVDN